MVWSYPPEGQKRVDSLNKEHKLKWSLFRGPLLTREKNKKKSTKICNIRNIWEFGV